MSNYKPQEFAEMLGVSVKTLQCWDRENRLKPSVLQQTDVIIHTNNI